MGRRSGQTRSRQDQWQQTAPPQQVCRAQPLHHQRLVQNGRQVQDHLDAPEFKTLALDRLHHRPSRHQVHLCEPCHEGHWVLDGPQTGHGCAGTAHFPAHRKPTQNWLGCLQCCQAEGPILPGTIPASTRWEASRLCDHLRQHSEMDLFQKNCQ